MIQVFLPVFLIAVSVGILANDKPWWESLIYTLTISTVYMSIMWAIMGGRV